MQLRRRKRAAESVGMGAALRQQALGFDPAELGLSEATVGGAVWGVVMDSRFDDGGWYTLVTLADDSTSLYTSGEFGVIGAGSHAKVRDSSRRLLRLVGESIALFPPSHGDELPVPGSVAIRALTFGGPRCLIAPEDQLGNGDDRASEVFHAIHDLITQVRMISEDQPPDSG